MITRLPDPTQHTNTCSWWLSTGNSSCNCGLLACVFGYRNQADGQFTEEDDALREQGGAA
jgi:hypothetical protein